MDAAAAAKAEAEAAAIAAAQEEEARIQAEEIARKVCCSVSPNKPFGRF